MDTIMIMINIIIIMIFHNVVVTKFSINLRKIKV